MRVLLSQLCCISMEELAKRCSLKMIQDKLRRKRFGHVRKETKGGVLRLVEEIWKCR